MDISTFRESLSGHSPSDKFSPYLQALWYDAKGDWEKAHQIVQDIDTRQAAAIHAYLHRKEGDISNARYWYDRAGRIAFKGSLDEEWTILVNEALPATP